MNNEELIKEIRNIDRDIIKTSFLINKVAYSGKYDFLNKQNNDELMKWLYNLSNIIKYNFEMHIFSSEVKYNLYKILCLFKDNLKDENSLNQIKELENLLLNSSEEDYNSLIVGEFNIRIWAITPLKKKMKLKRIQFELLEKLVKNSICADYEFFIGLTKQTEKEFLNGFVESNLALTNINNLIVNYSEIIKQQDLYNKLINLLNYNISSKNVKDTPFGSLQDCSKIVLKKIKKIK